MKVRLILIGPLKLPPQGRTIEYQCRKGTSVKTIIRRTLGYSEKEMGFVQIIRDGRSVHLDDKLTGDTDLYITLRLGGG